MFSVSLARTGSVKAVSEKIDANGAIQAELVEMEVSAETIKVTHSKLDDFLCWIERRRHDSNLRLETHHNISDEWLKHYINDYLILDKGASETSANQAVMALKFYYNWLAAAGLTTTKKISIAPNMRQTARSQLKSRLAVKYITPELRGILYSHAACLRDEAILRCGGEIGVRSKEVRGFTLNDFNYGRSKKHLGLLSLFTKLDEEKSRQSFAFLLRGTYTKAKKYSGGKARWVYINRDLLTLMRRYYNEERPKSDCDSFFLTNSTNCKACPISERQGTRTFADIRKAVINKQVEGFFPSHIQALEDEHTFHVLRHSFGTDTFHRLAIEDGLDVDNITPTSRAYLATAELLGHESRGKAVPETTAMYIRLCHIKMQLLEVGTHS